MSRRSYVEEAEMVEKTLAAVEKKIAVRRHYDTSSAANGCRP
jgi:hypothetical protein